MPYKDPAKAKAYRKLYDSRRPPRNDPAYRASTARGRKKFAARQRQFIRDYKCGKGCTDCGNTDFRVLDFDHRDRKHKKFCIANMLGRISMQRLLQEIEKCDVRCANCHRIKTWRENTRA